MIVSSDKYIVEMPMPLVNELIRACRESGDVETGGILVGRYSEDCSRAIITAIIEAPEDSLRSAFGFDRGTDGLSSELRRAWTAAERTYYVGEWHSHPGGPCRPSALDVASMRKIAAEPDAKCPEPILLIVSGACRDAGDVSLRIITRSDAPVTLTEV